jgi:hypothetical protein
MSIDERPIEEPVTETVLVVTWPVAFVASMFLVTACIFTCVLSVCGALVKIFGH